MLALLLAVTTAIAAETTGRGATDWEIANPAQMLRTEAGARRSEANWLPSPIVQVASALANASSVGR